MSASTSLPTSPDGTPFDVRVEADAPLQVLALDDLRARRRDEVHHLAQRNEDRLAVGPGLAAHHVQLSQVRGHAPPGLGQLDIHFVVLPIGCEPAADDVAGDEWAHGRSDLLDREAQVARELVVHP
jgi:hypothetical protein